jgi:hypothetical protein
MVEANQSIAWRHRGVRMTHPARHRRARERMAPLPGISKSGYAPTTTGGSDQSTPQSRSDQPTGSSRSRDEGASRSNCGVKNKPSNGKPNLGSVFTHKAALR